MNDDYLVCLGCSKPIYEGDEILTINLNEDVPEIIIHKNAVCFLMLDGVEVGTLGPVIR